MFSDAPAEAEVELTMRPQSIIRPRLYEDPKRTGQYRAPITESSLVATFGNDFQEREHSNLVQGEELQNVIIAIQSGTVTLAPALSDMEFYEAQVDEVDDNALTLVPRERLFRDHWFPHV